MVPRGFKCRQGRAPQRPPHPLRRGGARSRSSSAPRALRSLGLSSCRRVSSVAEVQEERIPNRRSDKIAPGRRQRQHKQLRPVRTLTSLRAGFVTSAGEKGATADCIMDHTGHRSVAMVRVYTRGPTPSRTTRARGCSRWRSLVPRSGGAGFAYRLRELHCGLMHWLPDAAPQCMPRLSAAPTKEDALSHPQAAHSMQHDQNTDSRHEK